MIHRLHMWAAALNIAQCMHPKTRSLSQERLLLLGSDRPTNISVPEQECLKKWRHTHCEVMAHGADPWQSSSSSLKALMPLCPNGERHPSDAAAGSEGAAPVFAQAASSCQDQWKTAPQLKAWVEHCTAQSEPSQPACSLQSSLCSVTTSLSLDGFLDAAMINTCDLGARLYV